jgi:hypothetical protein
MKNYIYLLMLTFAIGSVNIHAQNNPTTVDQKESIVMNGPIMTFESLTVDYGTIDKNSEPLRVAKFTNTGTEPLIIKNARGSCGCTVPEWPKEPIMPGETAQIEIRYATNRIGKFNKKVTLTTNVPGDPIVLTVKGEVLKEKEGVPSAEPNIIKSGNN